MIATQPTAAKPRTVRLVPASIEAAGYADGMKGRTVAGRHGDVSRRRRTVGVGLPWYGENADKADDEDAAHQSFHTEVPARKFLRDRTPFGTHFIQNNSQPDGANTLRLMRRDEFRRRRSRYGRPPGVPMLCRCRTTNFA